MAKIRCMKKLSKKVWKCWYGFDISFILKEYKWTFRFSTDHDSICWKKVLEQTNVWRYQKFEINISLKEYQNTSKLLKIMILMSLKPDKILQIYANFFHTLLVHAH